MVRITLSSHGPCPFQDEQTLTPPTIVPNRFLLKYASRDEIELLSRGNGGIVEVRKAIAEYDESSPLYGFLKYRRRNVIIKYLPEDCSRLIQGRWFMNSKRRGLPSDGRDADR